jgi:hypothetical protein
MASNPYKDLPASAFWKTGVAQENPYLIEGIYKKKFELSGDTRIATAGSCFAQHITRRLKVNGYNVIDVEPPPPGLSDNLHQKYGFSMYSARYGNIYTVRQLLQLAQEVAGIRVPDDYVWEKNGKFFDALRPAVEPKGLDSAAEVVAHRQHHILRVNQLFKALDVLIFTLGLTEMWVHRKSGTVYPMAPGTIAGEFDPELHDYQNATYADTIDDFIAFQELLVSIRANRPFKSILTVSPVPLTATADGKHVLVSTTYSKAVLRSVAGGLSTKFSYIDYFPSYEIVTNPRLHATSFTENLRSVRKETVDIVMQHFVREHPAIIPASIEKKSSSRHSAGHDDEAIKCEEALLEAFGS